MVFRVMFLVIQKNKKGMCSMIKGKTIQLDDYINLFELASLERTDGILQITLHDGKGQPLLWNSQAHTELPLLFRMVASDFKNKVVILTGAEDAFIPGIDKSSFQETIEPGQIYQEGKDMLHSLLDIPVPVIGVFPGPAHVHAELVLLSDIVLSSETATIKDSHFSWGVPPGDGVHTVWTLLLGMNRGRYYLLTGEEITPEDALKWGLINEILPKETLMSRAWELARDIAEKPDLTIRYTKEMITFELNRRIRDELSRGLALEGLATNF